ncbi:hypothetical protein D3C78_1929720 [compost metagenome]
MFDLLGEDQVADVVLAHQPDSGQDGVGGRRDDDIAFAVFADGHDSSPVRESGFARLAR